MRLILVTQWRFDRPIPVGHVVANLGTRCLISEHGHAQLTNEMFQAALLLLSVGPGGQIDRDEAYDFMWGDREDGGPLHTWACFYTTVERLLRRAPWIGLDYRKSRAGQIEVISTVIVPASSRAQRMKLAA